MITFVCFKWGSKYGPRHVHTLARMVRRHFTPSHNFICLTDDPGGVEVQTMALDRRFTNLGARQCFHKLAIFAPEASDRIGKRICAMDLDIVILDDLTPLVSRSEDFVIGDSGVTGFYNSSLMLLTAGSRPEVYDDFTPMGALKLTRAKGKPHIDDGWIGARLGMKEARFDTSDGVGSFRAKLPEKPRIVYFDGPDKPDGPVAQRLDWVRENYQ